MKNLAQLREETPGTRKVLHFNNAGASLMPEPVIQAMRQYLDAESLYGGYETARKSADALEGIYGQLAAVFGGKAEEYALQPNATQAWDMAFYSIPFQAGERILLSTADYASNYIACLHRTKDLDVSIEVIPNTATGEVDVDALANMMDERVRLVSLTHIPTNSGLINPAKAVGDVLRSSDAYYLLDACQSAGQIPVNVDEIGCDFMSATSRKYLRGPRGVGFLYVNKKILPQLNPPFLDLHSAEWTGRNAYERRGDARCFESWESSLMNRAGFSEALRYLEAQGIENISKRIIALADELRGALSAIKGIKVQDIGKERCGIVSFTSDELTPKAIFNGLALQGINVSVSIRSGTRIDMEERGLDEVVRASVHYYNTSDEIKRFCQALSQLSKN